MNLRLLRSVSVAAVLLAPSLASAQTEDDPFAAPEETHGTDEPPADADATADTGGDTEASGSIGFGAGGDTSAEADADADATAKVDAAKPMAKADAKAPAGEKAATDTGAPTLPEPSESLLSSFKARLFGFAALNIIHDSTQSFLFAHNNLIARPGTYAGDHDQLQLSAKDSRFGFELKAPEFEGMKARIYGEVDFQGLQGADVTEENTYIFGTMRMRHFYLDVQTPVVDILAGQYHDLFGWGGFGFYPTTVAFLGISGEIYNRQPQLRVTKTFGGEYAELKVAAAAMRPIQRASGIPDGEAGIRFALPKWQGAQAQAYGQPGAGPFAIGVSGIMRKFEVAEFLPTPGQPKEALGWGVAGNLFLPIIPTESATERSNALSFVGEAVMGSGISDLYTALTGGAAFPVLQNPLTLSPPPVYAPDVDNGIVTFDGNYDLHTVNWRSFVLNLTYYLPIDSGRVWIAGTYTHLYSDNLVELTPVPSRGGVFAEAQYIDGSLFFALTPSVQINGSFQTTAQTYNDGIVARNNRTQFGVYAFF